MNVFRRTAAAVAVIGALVAGATTLSAHMKVEKSEPAANATVLDTREVYILVPANQPPPG